MRILKFILFNILFFGVVGTVIFFLVPERLRSSLLGLLFFASALIQFKIANDISYNEAHAADAEKEIEEFLK